MKVYYDKDADLSIIQGMKVAILGYGSPLFLRDPQQKSSFCPVRWLYDNGEQVAG